MIYFPIKGCREWPVQQHTHNIKSTERGWGENELIYHYECCIVKALCNSGGHLLRHLVWTAAEEKSYSVKATQDTSVESSRKYAKETWKWHILSWYYTSLKSGGQENPSSSLQHMIWILAALRHWVFEQQKACHRLCGIKVLWSHTLFHQTEDCSTIQPSRHLKEKLSLLPHLHLNPFTAQLLHQYQIIFYHVAKVIISTQCQLSSDMNLRLKNNPNNPVISFQTSNRKKTLYSP